MSQKVIRCALPLLASVVMTSVLIAQATPPQSSQPMRGNQALQALDGQTVTAVGCLMQEKDVPGQRPNIAERAGVAEDYVLANAKLSAATSTGSGAAATTPGAPATAGAAPTVHLKVTGIDRDKLKTNLNKQVEVQGRLEVDPDDTTAAAGKPAAGTTGAARAGGTTPPATPPATPERAKTGDDKPIPEVRATTIKVVGETCKAAQ